jgi:hypothetical protein
MQVKREENLLTARQKSIVVGEQAQCERTYCFESCSLICGVLTASASPSPPHTPCACHLHTELFSFLDNKI